MIGFSLLGFFGHSTGVASFDYTIEVASSLSDSRTFSEQLLSTDIV